MGLDTTINIHVRNKNTNKYSDFTICYFRKCYAIARRLEELWLDNEDCQKVLEYDRIYRIPANKDAFNGIYSIIFEKYTDVFNNYCDNYFIDTIWNVSSYMTILNRNIHNIALFYMFINGSIDIKDMINCNSYTNFEEIANFDDWDWDEAVLELCNSY